MSFPSRGKRRLDENYSGVESLARSGFDRVKDDVRELKQEFGDFKNEVKSIKSMISESNERSDKSDTVINLEHKLDHFEKDIRSYISKSNEKPREFRESESKLSRYFNENDMRINASNLRFEEVINRQEQKYKNLENITLGLTTMIKESHSIQNSRLDELSRMISSNKNLIVWILIIVAIILGVVLVVLLIWIIVKIVRNDNKDDKC